MRITKRSAHVGKLAIVFLLAVSMVVAVMYVANMRTRNVSAATQLISETFRGNATQPGQWQSGGNAPACLTAGDNTSGSIPACPGVADTSGNGALRLTTNANHQAGFAFLNTPIQANAGLNIIFSMYQYGGSGITPGERTGDGISFFLIDGNASPTGPGAPGMGLGYASRKQDPSCTANCAYEPGLVGAYAGVGFDRYGNFSGDFVGSSGLFSTPGDPTYQNNIVIRGSEASNYGFVQGTAADGPLSDASSTRDPAERTVHITISTDSIMTVNVSYDGGATFAEELSDIDLKTINGSAPMPSTFKLGFAASTGGATNIHEIRDLVVETLDPDLATDVTAPTTLPRGGTADFSISVSNAASAGPTTGVITSTTTFPAGITPTAATGAGWTCTIAGQTVTCEAAAAATGETLAAITVQAAIASTVATNPSITSAVATTGDSDTTNNTDTLALSIPNDLQAVDDAMTVADGAVGSPNAGNLLANDTFNGTTVTPSTVTLSVVSPLPAGASVDTATGIVSVAPGTAAGAYSFDYQICDTTAPTNCQTATATVTVGQVAIAAANDSFTASSRGIVGNIFANDDVNSNPVDPATVTATLLSNGGIAGASIDGNGNVIVPEGTPAGTYVLSYRICLVTDPANCSDATITVAITGDAPGAPDTGVGRSTNLLFAVAAIGALALVVAVVVYNMRRRASTGR